jgi:transposase
MGSADDTKVRFLASHGALHPHPERVRDLVFQGSEFFDPRDLVQVRYEMLRRHLVDGRAVAELTRSFGISRQMFYRLAWAFRERGLAGLLPRKRGPRHAHRCTAAFLAFVTSRRAETPGLTIPELVADAQRKFGVRLHPRTLQRGLARQGKKLGWQS